MFARPEDNVFILDRLAKVAIGIRAARHLNVKRTVSYNVKGPNAYDGFHAQCTLELEAERPPSLTRRFAGSWSSPNSPDLVRTGSNLPRRRISNVACSTSCWFAKA